MMSPTSGRKNEYQRRVSPIVRNGGRSSEIHIDSMNAKNTNSPKMVETYATLVLSLQAVYAPTAQSRTATAAKYIKESQEIIENKKIRN
jgi:hypothetical protein